MHLFPRPNAEGNYSRIGHARVRFDGDKPVGVKNLGLALEPYESYESYELSPGGGGVEDPRSDGAIDVYYGVALRVTAAARVTLPPACAAR